MNEFMVYPSTAVEPVIVTPASPEIILALGGEIKPSLCLLHGDRALLRQPEFELTDPDQFRAFLRLVEELKSQSPAEPDCLACDMHPEYATTRFARSLDLARIEVQHHHAHVAACMAEHGLTRPVVGICCDGTGYGTDGAVWGCEILCCDRAGFSRMGHLDYFPLAGGDAAALDTWRPAAGLLHRTWGPDWQRNATDLFGHVDPDAIALLAQRLDGGAPLPRTSSLGRLFDAVAFLLGLCDRNRFDAEAPIAVESAAQEFTEKTDAYPFCIAEGPQGDDDGDPPPMRLDVRPMVKALVQDRCSNRPVPEMARAFHITVAKALAAMALSVVEKTGTNDIVLSGGCFANRILRDLLLNRLKSDRVTIWQHKTTSPGDQSLALGQAAVAAMQILKEVG